VCKNRTISDLCFMTLSRFEFCLSFQINISCCEETFVNVCVHRADRHIQFRVICKELIRGLPLLNQWRYNLVFLMELVLGHIYSRTRRYQQFTIFSVSSIYVQSCSDLSFSCSHCKHMEPCPIVYIVLFQSPCRSDYRLDMRRI
jgi:hypothetical protein